ncbi:MAG: hypothetical protein JJ902_03110 [Roseibium sp.]|nr:hypothetical protein [Roseibium sp.]
MAGIWTILSLKKGALELKMLPGIGGRLWDIVFQKRSLLFQNPDLMQQPAHLSALKDLPTRSPQFGFPLWGGEKTWVAPDRDWPDGAPYPVLDSGPYEFVLETDDQIEMTSHICPVSKLQVTRLISLQSADRFSIHHTLRNCGTVERTAGIWSVMMLNHPTTIRIEDPQAGTFAPVFGDPGPFVRTGGADLKVECMMQGEFKFGVQAPSGNTDLLAGHGADAVRLQCSTTRPLGTDSFAHGHNFEVFNSGDYPYCEAEWHAPEHQLRPGAQMLFSQEFHVSMDHPSPA